MSLVHAAHPRHDCGREYEAFPNMETRNGLQEGIEVPLVGCARLLEGIEVPCVACPGLPVAS